MTYTGVSPDEVECERVVPLVARLVAEGVTRLGRHLEGRRRRARRWRPAPHIVNDISGLADPRLADALRRERRGARRDAHARGAQEGAASRTTTATSRRRRRASCASAASWPRAHGVGDEQLIVDPGPDFAKTPGASRWR